LQDPDFLPSSSSEPHLITQGELKRSCQRFAATKKQDKVVGIRITAMESVGQRYEDFCVS